MLKPRNVAWAGGRARSRSCAALASRCRSGRSNTLGLAMLGNGGRGGGCGCAAVRLRVDFLRRPETATRVTPLAATRLTTPSWRATRDQVLLTLRACAQSVTCRLPSTSASICVGKSSIPPAPCGPDDDAAACRGPRAEFCPDGSVGDNLVRRGMSVSQNMGIARATPSIYRPILASIMARICCFEDQLERVQCDVSFIAYHLPLALQGLLCRNAGSWPARRDPLRRRLGLGQLGQLTQADLPGDQVDVNEPLAGVSGVQDPAAHRFLGERSEAGQAAQVVLANVC